MTSLLIEQELRREIASLREQLDATQEFAAMAETERNALQEKFDGENDGLRKNIARLQERDERATVLLEGKTEQIVEANRKRIAAEKEAERVQTENAALRDELVRLKAAFFNAIVCID
jgi:chromosome segregation ATPase